MRDELDHVLITIYHKGELPPEELNQGILQRAKEYEDMKQSGGNKKNDPFYGMGKMMKVAVAAIAILFIAGGGVYAAERLNLFGGLFGGADETSVKEYIADADMSDAAENDASSQADASSEAVDSNAGSETEPVGYEGVAEEAGYKVTVTHHMYNREMGTGVLQFTVEDLTGKGRQWYDVAGLDETCDDWKMGSRDQTEIYTGIEDGKQYINFAIGGLHDEDSRTYIDAASSTDNKKVCQIVYNDFEENDLSGNLSLVVKEQTTEKEVTSYGVLMTLQIPKAESLPCYVWKNAKPYTKVVLSNFCYLLAAPDINSDSYEHRNELTYQSKVYVTMKDGTQYCIYDKDNKIDNVCYGTMNNNDTQWYSFFNLLNLEQVESFTIDGVTLKMADATLMK